MQDFTQDRIRALFALDEAKGVLIWKRRPASDFKTTRIANIWNTKYAGRVAGSVSKRGYRMIGIDDHPYYAHRLIWLHIHGYMPVEIDHIDHVKDNNVPQNLRDVDHLDNSKNHPIPATNSSGVAGVCWDRTKGKWVASLMIRGSNKHLGYFINKDDAAAARRAGEREYGFHKNHGKYKLPQVA